MVEFFLFSAAKNKRKRKQIKKTKKETIPHLADPPDVQLELARLLVLCQVRIGLEGGVGGEPDVLVLALGDRVLRFFFLIENV